MVCCNNKRVARAEFVVQKPHSTLIIALARTLRAVMYCGAYKTSAARAAQQPQLPSDNKCALSFFLFVSIRCWRNHVVHRSGLTDGAPEAVRKTRYTCKKLKVNSAMSLLPKKKPQPRANRSTTTALATQLLYTLHTSIRCERQTMLIDIQLAHYR